MLLTHKELSNLSDEEYMSLSVMNTATDIKWYMGMAPGVIIHGFIEVIGDVKDTLKFRDKTFCIFGEYDDYDDNITDEQDFYRQQETFFLQTPDTFFRYVPTYKGKEILSGQYSLTISNNNYQIVKD